MSHNWYNFIACKLTVLPQQTCLTHCSILADSTAFWKCYCMYILYMSGVISSFRISNLQAAQVKWLALKSVISMLAEHLANLQASILHFTDNALRSLSIFWSLHWSLVSMWPRYLNFAAWFFLVSKTHFTRFCVRYQTV